MLFKFIPFTIQIPIITASIITLKKNTGIVILVGKAARFTTKQLTIAAIANGHRKVELPENIIASIVRMVITHPCPATAIASHNIRFSSCAAHQLIKRVHKDS